MSLLVRSRQRGPGKLKGRVRRGPKLAKISRNPSLVAVGSKLTDGADDYEVLDIHVREWGERWVKLENVKFRGRVQWFPMRDIGELAVVF